MARNRLVKKEFWEDRSVCKLSLNARLTFIAFWNFADDLGVIYSDPVWLLAKCFPYDGIKLHVFSKWVSELEAYNFIVSFNYQDKKHYWIRTFHIHQTIDKPNYRDIFVPKPIVEGFRNKGAIEFISNSANGSANHSHSGSGNQEHINSLTNNNIKQEENYKQEGEGNGGTPPIGDQVFVFSKTFRESEWFDQKKLEAEFLKIENSEYHIFDIAFYYNRILNWSDGNSATRTNWIAQIKQFMLGDAREGRAALKGGNNQNQNNHGNNGRGNVKHIASGNIIKEGGSFFDEN